MEQCSKKSKDEEYRRNWRKEYFRKMRLVVLETLGNKCIRCGFSDIRALQIDHINGGGLKERKEKGRTAYGYLKKVVNSFLAGEKKYQLLCANCNWIKRCENNENSSGGKKL